MAGDLLWYPIEGNNTLRRAPDMMVVFGRSKAIAVLISNGKKTMSFLKFQFYDRYGVEEYYLYDPLKLDFSAWKRKAIAGNQ